VKKGKKAERGILFGVQEEKRMEATTTTTATTTTATATPSSIEEATQQRAEEAQTRPQPPTDPMARGIYELFAPIVHEYDARVQSVLQTQEQLAKQIDKLSSGLIDRYL